MQRDVPAVERLSFVENVEVEDIVCNVIISGEVFTIYAPDYPAGAPSAEIRGQTVTLRAGNLVSYVNELHELSKTMAFADSSPQSSFVIGPPEPCAAFLKDVDAVKRVFGPNAVSFTQIEAFTEGTYRARVEMKLDPAPLFNKLVAECYGVDHSNPIVLRLTIMDISSYNEMRDTKMECFQTTRASNLAAQVQRIFAHPGRLVKIWDSDEKAKGKRLAVAPPPVVAYEEIDDPPPPVAIANAPTTLSDKQRKIKNVLIEMAFDEKQAHAACQLAQTADEAASLIMDHPEVLTQHEETKKAKSGRQVDASTGRVDRRADAAAQQDLLRRIANGTNVLPTDETDENKGIPLRNNGFLVQVMQYAISRIKTISSYCVICDQTHLFSGGAMVKPAICNRDLCVFSFNELQVASDAADEVATDAGVIDLLICMLKAAAFSERTDRILSPFPSVMDPKSSTKKLALDPKSPDAAKVKSILLNFPSVRSISQANDFGEMKRKLDVMNPLAFPLMQWTINSNRSHIVKLRKEDHLEKMATPHQYMLLTAAPAKQAKFNELKAKYGTKFAFHGSGIENWHCILREGLKNASGTALQVNGTACGNGIYFGLTAETSLGYCRSFELKTEATRDVKKDAQSGAYIDERNMICLALCEIADHNIKDHGWCWTLEDEDYCMTRFFFVYEASNTGTAGQADATKGEFLKDIKASMKYHGMS